MSSRVRRCARALAACGAFVACGVVAQEAGGPAGSGVERSAAPKSSESTPAPPAITNTTAPRLRAPSVGTRAAEQSVATPSPAIAPPSDGSAAAVERNEFQDFIAASIGHTLPLYGYNLFQAPSTFAPVENVPVTPDYVIGPGDELLIRAWGQIDVDYRAIVDRSGIINIPRVGAVPVAGVPYKDITAHVRKAVARNFRNFELMVTMGELRSIQVFVVGQARRPGAYTVSSLSTLVNAIFAAGGPSSRGSMRAIQLKRGASVVTELDLYDLIAFGDKSKRSEERRVGKGR